MPNLKIIYFLVLIHINQSKLVSYNNNKNLHEPECKHKCELSLLNQTQARFIDSGIDNSTDEEEVEPPSSKFSVLNLISDYDDVENDEDEVDKDEDEDVKDDREEDDAFAIFDFEEDNDDPDDLKEDGNLKQYHRHRHRMQNMMFPLLLAYKLKFFTVIPLLLGLLVLLVGSTGIAGFFFALFAAALGIQAKKPGH